MLPMVVTRSSSDSNRIRYVLPVFVDDVMFSHSRANRPESKTTRMFRTVHQVAHLVQNLHLIENLRETERQYDLAQGRRFGS